MGGLVFHVSWYVTESEEDGTSAQPGEISRFDTACVIRLYVNWSCTPLGAQQILIKLVAIVTDLHYSFHWMEIGYVFGR